MAFLSSFVEFPYLIQRMCLVLLVVLILSVWDALAGDIPHARIPLVGKSWWDVSNRKAKLRFTKAARALMAEGFSKVGG